LKIPKPIKWRFVWQAISDSSFISATHPRSETRHKLAVVASTEFPVKVIQISHFHYQVLSWYPGQFYLWVGLLYLKMALTINQASLRTLLD
jgi:hypothetical protein